MDTSSLVLVKDQKEKPNALVEVVNLEKQLWLAINTKGLLHSDVRDLYQKVCDVYEKIILSDLKLAELQDAEYSLWKLHYRHIDEFRKRIKRRSVTEETAIVKMPHNVVATHKSNEDHKERFKSFLLEATKFYQNMIVKIRRVYGFPEDFYRSCLDSATIESKEMRKVQILIHRFLVCLGDLARYREQCEKTETQNHNWSVAVSHYLESTIIWPDSGNPQNQLAVLAMYVGDEFLALYHCIRSLSVKEPFPDAWNNLILLFERNKSAPLRSLSSEARFDFSKPSESNFQTKLQSYIDSSNCRTMKVGHEGVGETDLWPLIIRMISYFFIKSSMEDYPCTFASAIQELDALLALDDAKLKVAMESYQRMDSARNGPFRTLQVVSVFIFVIEDLINSPEVKESKNNNDTQQLVLTQLALTATFIFMGRFAHRCLKANLLEICPLLPSLLVFVEWLTTILDEAQKYGSDDNKCTRAMSYFFSAFLALLKLLDINRSKASSPIKVALWEDYELRGFAPLSRSQVSLDFSTQSGNMANFESGAECRTSRIIDAAMKIADMSDNNLKWLLYDKSIRKFSVADSNKFPEEQTSEKAKSPCNVLELKRTCKHSQETTKECDKPIVEEKVSDSQGVCKSGAVEDEEEVILFKPLTRYNSAPVYSPVTCDAQMPPKDAGDSTVRAEECLRRATSMLIAQNATNGDPSVFQSDLTNFKRNKPAKQQELLIKDNMVHLFSELSLPHGAPPFSTSISAGPPSLNAWVLDVGILNSDRVKGKSNTSKPALAPIEEIASPSLNNLSINSTESVIDSGYELRAQGYSSPSYTTPVPSAPLLPDDAVWISGMQSTAFSDSYASGDCSVGVPQVSGYPKWAGSHQLPNYGNAVPGFTDGYPPTRRMTSSEWLRQYRENQNLERATTHSRPTIHSYAVGNNGLFHVQDSSMSGVLDQWGSPLASNPLVSYEGNSPLHPGFLPVYGSDDQRREKLFSGYQRPGAYYGCGTVYEPPEPLLQYLKEKEWLLQQNPTLRGPTYMGS